MADYTITFTWTDGQTQRKSVRYSGRDSQGWVESIGVFRTSAGPVYVIVNQGKWSTSDYSIGISAFRIKKGAEELDLVAGFFPAIPGCSEDGSSILWEHKRLRGVDVFPRPFEVRVDEEHPCLRVWVLPRAALWWDGLEELTGGRIITLSLQGDRLTCPDFGDVDKQAIVRATEFHRGNDPAVRRDDMP